MEIKNKLFIEWVDSCKSNNLVQELVQTKEGENALFTAFRSGMFAVLKTSLEFSDIAAIITRKVWDRVIG